MFTSKEEALQLLHSLCSDPAELLADSKKLATFNVFLVSPDLGFPLPVEFAIGSLFRHPLVVYEKVSPEVSRELDFTRKLCADLLRCRRKAFPSEKSDNLMELF